ncbi:MAG: ribosome-associated translation inhibitor RaiA [Mesorhizobium sp.]|nr:ribosome-associated translation inhibitor RaiA [Mesorhizobium sp.]
MNLRISGKHMEIGDAFRLRIEERIRDAVGKYFDRGFSGHVTVEKSGSRYTADCAVHLDSGMMLQAAGQAQDPQLAFEAAAERIEKRLRRYKRRLKSHNAVSPSATAEEAAMAYRVIESFPDEDVEEDFPEDFSPAIVAESVLAVRTMSVASAVIELDAKDSPVFVFRNAGSEELNIVYRRSDGNIGWIDPTLQNGGR